MMIKETIMGGEGDHTCTYEQHDGLKPEKLISK